MKSKINIQTVILCLTGVLFIAGLFYIGWATRQRIHSAESEFSSFEEQLQEQKNSLESAKAAFEDAIQSEKDILNWRARKAAGISSVSQDPDPNPDISSETRPSIFSQNTTPEYNSFSNEDTSSDSSDIWSDSDDSSSDYNSDQPVA